MIEQPDDEKPQPFLEIGMCDCCPTCGSHVRGARGIIPPPPDRHIHFGVDFCNNKWHEVTKC